MINVGIGLTSKCNCNCSHCYSRIYGNEAFLNTTLLFEFVNHFNINSVNFGTGESFFHPDYFKIISYLYDKGIRISLTTNGYTIANMDDVDIIKLHDVDFSLDYPLSDLHDAHRQIGCFKMVKEGIKRCKKLGVTASVAWCLTPKNCKYIPEMISLCKDEGVYLRVNILKPVHGFSGFSYDLFWKSINTLFKWGNIVSCSEGIVNAAINNKNSCQGCNNHNIRIFPDGTVSSCVYIQNKKLNLSEVCKMTEDQLASFFSPDFKIDESSFCHDCNYLSICRSGCLARRIITNEDHDEFCFIERTMPSFERIVFSNIQSDCFVHSNYICTIILEANIRNEN